AVALFTAVVPAGAPPNQKPNPGPFAPPPRGGSKGRQVGPPRAGHQSPLHPPALEDGNALSPPPRAQNWNPAKIKLMQEGAKLVGGTVSSGIDPSTYCAMANAGYDFIWTEMQHANTTWDQAGKAWRTCPHAKAVPGARVPYADEFQIQHA